MTLRNALYIGRFQIQHKFWSLKFEPEYSFKCTNYKAEQRVIVLGLRDISTYFKVYTPTKLERYVNYWSHGSYANFYAFISFSCWYEHRS